MTQKYCFSNILIWVSENKEFDAEFESVEIVVKKVYRKKTFVHSTDGKTYIIFYTFMLVPFLRELFYNFFIGIKISI
jgi:hypothetical protein